MRVLQVIPDLSISNGAMSMIMNYQRAMSADVQFDYLYFLDTQADRRAEIEALGGHAYKMDFPKPKDVLPTKKMRAFFLEHKGTLWWAISARPIFRRKIMSSYFLFLQRYISCDQTPNFC